MKDDENMIPEWVYDRINNSFISPGALENSIKSFTLNEKIAFGYFNQVAEKDLEGILSEKEEIFSSEEVSAQFFMMILWKYLLIGYMMGEAKWISSNYTIDHEDKNLDPKRYIPKKEDFI